MKIRKGQNRVYRFFDPGQPHASWALLGKQLPLDWFSNPPRLIAGGIYRYMVPDKMIKL